MKAETSFIRQIQKNGKWCGKIQSKHVRDGEKDFKRTRKLTFFRCYDVHNREYKKSAWTGGGSVFQIIPQRQLGLILYKYLDNSQKLEKQIDRNNGWPDLSEKLLAVFLNKNLGFDEVSDMLRKEDKKAVFLIDGAGGQNVSGDLNRRKAVADTVLPHTL